MLTKYLINKIVIVIYVLYSKAWIYATSKIISFSSESKPKQSKCVLLGFYGGLLWRCHLSGRHVWLNGLEFFLFWYLDSIFFI